MTLNRGVTREVFLTHRWAVKVPSLRSWRLFLTGLLANMQETEFSNTGWPELCPVVFHLPIGFMVVMPRVETLTEPLPDVEYMSIVNQENYQIPAENKPCSWGWYKGKLVAVDYGS